MSKREVPEAIWSKMEELYLDAATQTLQNAYAESTEGRKRAILIDFAVRQAAKSQRWSTILQDLSACCQVS